MPKLSKNSLEKMFTCQYCGKPVRTRQGLSGHIQWKHKVQQPLSMADLSGVIRRAKHLEARWNSEGLSHSRELARIVARWADVIGTCDDLNIRTNNQDFKDYFIASLARMYENEELEERLISRVKNL